jgi:thiosulfate dehydrogenase [quinone] large subunit
MFAPFVEAAILEMAMREPSYAFLLPIRLFAGWVFLTESLAKLSGDWVAQKKLTLIVGGWLREGKTYAFYVPFLREVVLPHADTFAWAIIAGELLVGAALLAGLFTRLAAFGGVLLVGNFMLARGDGAAPNQTAPFVAMLLTLMLTHAGRTLGLDVALRGKVPAWFS